MDILSIPRLEPSRHVPVAVMLLGSAAFVGLSFVVAPVLVPGVLLLAVIFLLIPLRKNPLVLQLMIMSILLVAIWFFSEVSEILLAFIIGTLLVYVINPLVTRLEARGVPRWASSLVFVLLLVGGTVALFAIGIPRLMEKMDRIDRGLRTILHQLTAAVESGEALPGVDSYGASPA